jgi:hypothetical protein
MHPSKFLVSTVGNVVNLFAAADRRGIDLGFALDLPQIFSAHLGSKLPTPLEIEHLLEKLRPVAHRIETLHMGSPENSAQRNSRRSFRYDPSRKKHFLMVSTGCSRMAGRAIFCRR